ncbi:S-layer homology domain-containing protein [Sporomusa malonica]|uniref:S-layer homology domain-containing protein n=1 Tax=Sporomusa malonica TaxID=112901 RepID=A0A1W1ZF60_9FIRM|nr:S-layer homology domain-containing protein [Sporomusa malonica]SMC46832.1 S-layer homology domain-containing protein [Sporomusa malonica]
MKKPLITLVILMVFCISNLAFAAGSTFSDLPAKHWAYDAVKKLADAGVIDGVGDGTFRGDKTMTRYEMALIVANALTKEEKANAETKAVLEKLSAEFSKELTSIGVRVKTLEDKDTNSLKFSGVARIRHEWTENPRPLVPDAALGGDPYYTGQPSDKSELRTALYVFVDKKFDSNNYFHATIGNDSISGDTRTDSSVQFEEAYYVSKNGNFEWSAGRFIPTVGKGLLFNAPYVDGGKVSFGKDMKTTIYSGKKTDYTWLLADTQFKLNKNTKMLFAYTSNNKGSDTGLDFYDSKAVGLEYTGIPNFNLQGEYGVNTATNAKLFNGGDSPKGMYIRAKYKGANPFAVGTLGAWVGYRKADNGFDILQYTGALTAPNNWTYPAQSSSINDVQGFEYGFEVTVAPQAMLSVIYGDLEAVKVGGLGLPDKSQKFLISQLTWIF